MRAFSTQTTFPVHDENYNVVKILYRDWFWGYISKVTKIGVIMTHP